MLTKLKKLFLATSLAMTPIAAFALTYQLPAKGDDIVGQVNTISVSPKANLHKIAQKYDVGYDALLSANPSVSQHMRLFKRKLVIPSEFILPPGPHKGIVVSTAEMDLYYYPPNSDEVMIFPVGIGMQGTATPTADTSVLQKIPNPSWYVPKSIAKSLAQEGVYLENMIPHSPDDPLGDYALRLALSGYLIHGTNEPDSVGQRSSSGCIRLLPQDIDTLFHHVSAKTPVRIIDNPYKIGVDDGKVYLEAHEPLLKKGESENSAVANMTQEILKSLQNQNKADINIKEATKVAEDHTGIPTVIGTT